MLSRSHRLLIILAVLLAFFAGTRMLEPVRAKSPATMTEIGIDNRACINTTTPPYNPSIPPDGCAGYTGYVPNVNLDQTAFGMYAGAWCTQNNPLPTMRTCQGAEFGGVISAENTSDWNADGAIRGLRAECDVKRGATGRFNGCVSLQSGAHFRGGFTDYRRGLWIRDANADLGTLGTQCGICIDELLAGNGVKWAIDTAGVTPSRFKGWVDIGGGLLTSRVTFNHGGEDGLSWLFKDTDQLFYQGMLVTAKKAGTWQAGAPATFDTLLTFRVQEDNSLVDYLQLDGSKANQGGIQFLKPAEFTGTQKLNNTGAVPVTNPVGGGYLYVDNGALRWRGPNGTVTTLALP